MRPRWLSIVPVAMLSVVMLGSLMMLSEAVQNSARFGQLYVALLAINGLGLFTFIVLIGINVWRLVVQVRRQQPGARLTVRLVSLFIALAVAPVVVLYGFSLHFLRQGIDSWFDVRIDRALADSLDLSRAALEIRMRELHQLTRQLAEEIGEGGAPVAPLALARLRDPGDFMVANAPGQGGFRLDSLRERSGAHELLLLSSTGGLLASSTLDDTQIVPNLPPETMLLQLKQGQSYIGLDPIRGEGLYVRVAVPVPGLAMSRDGRILQALYPVAGRMNRLAGEVEAAYAKFTELAYLREQLKLSFIMSLTLVLLFSVFCAVWAAFASARRLVAPLRDLADGTAAVARGNYETTLPVTTRDEIGFLALSFNEMTRRIAAARDEARASRDEVDSQRAYLAAVLGRLSSGVLTLDGDGRIRTSNPSAAQMLGLAEETLAGVALAEVAERHPALAPLVDAVAPRLGAADWQAEAVLMGAGGRQILMCRGTTLPDAAGSVVVFDDITALVQAQRDAAWGEAARRLAHEIKNPLTPIQLSAERLRHKYLRTMRPEDAGVLDRLTNTIVQQVETMKGMVNAFSEYARAPRLQPQATDLGALAEEVAELFRSSEGEVSIETEVAAGLPPVHADPGRLRQVLNNLVKNALEAVGTEVAPLVRIAVRHLPGAVSPQVEIMVEDNGDGVPEAMLASVFDPYVTTKPKGTGLGLAIVRKIIEEHGGLVRIENKPAGGACVIIRLPVNSRGGPAEAARQTQKDAV